MAILNIFFLILITVLGPAVRSMPYCGYCSVPCPFLYPASSPWSYGTAARRPHFIARTTVADNYTDIDEDTDIIELPASKPSPAIKPRTPDAEPSNSPASPPKPKTKEDPEPSPQKKEKKSPPQPTRRFFTSLFSIPGAVVDTLLSGEIVL